MAKRLTQKQKEKIIQSFLKGKSIDILSQEFDCSKLTIIRNVKKDIGESRYKLLLKKNQNVKHNPEKKNINNIENISFESSKIRIMNSMILIRNVVILTIFKKPLFLKLHLLIMI